MWGNDKQHFNFRCKCLWTLRGNWIIVKSVSLKCSEIKLLLNKQIPPLWTLCLFSVTLAHSFKWVKTFNGTALCFAKQMRKISLTHAILKAVCFLHLTQVGLAVGDIDSIQQNATLKRFAMQVEFVAEIEESYPRFITRRVYHPSLVVKPNRPTRWKRYHSMWICLVQSATMKKLALRIFCMPCMFEI